MLIRVRCHDAAGLFLIFIDLFSFPTRFTIATQLPLSRRDLLLDLTTLLHVLLAYLV